MKKGSWANIYFTVFTFLLLHLKSKTEICSGIIKLWSRSRTASKNIKIPKFLCIVQYTGIVHSTYSIIVYYTYVHMYTGNTVGTVPI